MRLVADGTFFRLETGEPWTAVECSDFSLYARYLVGEDLRPVHEQRRDEGFNLRRVWLLNTSVVSAAVPGGIHPGHYLDFYARLRDFADECASYGARVEFTAFTQTPLLMPRRDDQQRHLDRIEAALSGHPAVLLELVNEYDHRDQQGHLDNICAPDLRRPSGILCSRGSATADAWPPGHEAPWDYELYHSNGLEQWQRKLGHNAMEIGNDSQRPVISNENTRYDDDPNPVHAHDGAAGAAFLCAGACCHTPAGKLSALWAGDELTWVRAWVAGARSVPLDFQRGAYYHRADLEGSGVIRVYEKRLADGRNYILPIRE